MAFTNEEVMRATELALRQYHILGSSDSEEEAYSPPSDWPTVDDVPDGSIRLLLSDMFLATYCFDIEVDSGTFTVDWGDGTSETHSGFYEVEHTYTVGAGTPCSRGYTTFVCTITPDSGGLIFFRMNNISLSQHIGISGILAAAIRSSTIPALDDAFSFGEDCYYLEYVHIFEASSCIFARNMCSMALNLKEFDLTGMSNLIDASYMFNSCYSLTKVDLSPLTELTNAEAMFFECVSLKEIDASVLTKVVSLESFVEDCHSLQTANFSNLSSVKNIRRLCSYCYALENVDVSGMTEALDAYDAFDNCSSLRAIDISDLTKLQFAQYMFGNCYSLSDVKIGSKPFLTEASSMFRYCNSLVSVDITGLTKVTDADYMFYYCYSLQSISANTFARDSLSEVSMKNAFYCCEHLKDISLPMAKVKNLGARGSTYFLNRLETLLVSSSSTFGDSYTPQLDLRYNTLSAAQINQIFTDLPTVSSKYVYVGGCPGSSTCDPSIATAKGWIVVA